MNLECFAGLREIVLLRDRGRCQVCAEDGRLVHHRRPGVNDVTKLITLCFRCHAKVHHTKRPSFAFASHAFLLKLWRELHRDLPEQLLLVVCGKEQPVDQVKLF